MGRPRVKVIDDSQPEEPKKEAQEDKKEAKKITGRSFGGKKGGDSLVESLKAELGIEEESSRKSPESSEKDERSSKSISTDVSEKSLEIDAASESKEAKKTTVKKTAQKTKPRSKKYQEKIQTLQEEMKPEDADENYTYKSVSYKLPEAIEMVKKLSYSKFDGTLEAHINTTVTGIRGLISLPYVSGKKLRILAFGKGAEDAGVDIVGDESTLDIIGKGKIDFDLVITTPEWMPKLAKAAKYLGPRGLMPNPKNGTIALDLKKAVESFQAGKTEYKTESKGKVIHLGLGKLNQPSEELSANIKILLQTLGKSRISKVTLSPTMGAAVKVDLSSI
jgi:large subunit ribosomal protein L1